MSIIPVKPKICIVVGESSGDSHAALLVEHLRGLIPEIEIFAMGGRKLQRAGVEIIVDSEASASVMGITELFGSIGKIVSAFKTVENECTKRDPNLVILVDYPDFNLRLVKRLKKPGRKILYFIGPQLWAWRSGRVETIRRYVDFVAAIFPFEEPFYKQRGVCAEYVGHPFLDLPFPQPNPEKFFDALETSPLSPSVALLPGSRKSEVERLLAPMLEAFVKFRELHPRAQALIPRAPAVPYSLITRHLPVDRRGIFVVEGQARECLVNCELALVASGTATVEAALAAIPFAVVYRLSNFSYLIARALVKGINHFAMPNLIAGENIVSEFLQGEVSGESLFRELQRMYCDENYRAEIKRGLLKVRERLQLKTGASLRVAEIARDLLIREKMDSLTGEF